MTEHALDLATLRWSDPGRSAKDCRSRDGLPVHIGPGHPLWRFVKDAPTAEWEPPEPDFSDEIEKAEQDAYLIETAARLALSRMGARAADPGADPALEDENARLRARIAELEAAGGATQAGEPEPSPDIKEMMQPGETLAQAVSRLLPEIAARLDELTQKMHRGAATDEETNEHQKMQELKNELARLGDETQ